MIYIEIVSELVIKYNLNSSYLSVGRGVSGCG